MHPKTPQTPWPSHSHTTDAPELVGHKNVDTVIIGGGFAGLSAAWHLAQRCDATYPAHNIVLIEAHTIGAGASGQNTGMLGPEVGGGILTLRRKFGDTRAAQIFRASADAVAYTTAWIRHQRFACSIENTGQLKVAVTPKQAHRQQRVSQAFTELGFNIPYLNAQQLQNRLGTIGKPYHGGINFTDAATINPVQLCQELYRALLDLGVRVYTQTPALSVTAGSPVRIVTPKGTLTARKAVLATNAYTAASLGLLGGRVVPLHTHAILTEPLSASKRASLGWHGREAMIDTRNFFNYFRLTPDDRVMFGGGSPLYKRGKRPSAGATTAHNPATWRALEAELLTIFPTLTGVRIVKRWSGAMGFTLDRFPIVGAVDSTHSVIFAGAWCGHGLALALASGRDVERLVFDAQPHQPHLPWFRGSAPWLAPDPLRELGLGAWLKTLGWADRLGQAIAPTTAKSTHRPLEIAS